MILVARRLIDFARGQCSERNIERSNRLLCCSTFASGMAEAKASVSTSEERLWKTA